MPLLQTGVLEEYVKVTTCIWRTTGGRTCNLNSASGRIKFYRRPCVISAVLSAFFGLPAIIQAVTFLCSGKTSGEDAYAMEREMLNLRLLSIQGHLCGFVFSASYVWHCKNMEWLWNQLFVMERKYLKHDASLVTKKKVRLAKLCCKIFGIAVRLVGPGCAILATMNSKLPFNLFRYSPGSGIIFLSESIFGSGTFGYVISKVITFSGNFVLWGMNAKRGCVFTIELLIGCLSLTVLLERFKGKMQKICSSSNKAEFSRDISRANILYRQIQILGTVFNEIVSGQLINFLLTFGVGQITSALELIRFSANTNQNFGAYVRAGFSMTVLPPSLVAINFIFGFCGHVHETSSRISNDMRSRVTGCEPIMYRKLRRSYPLVRVNFGSANYIDQFTPCVFQMFLVARFMDLLLIKKV